MLFLLMKQEINQWRVDAMVKLFKITAELVAFIGLMFICADGYVWHITGRWGTTSFTELVSMISGTEVHAPEPDKEFLYRLVH